MATIPGSGKPGDPYLGNLSKIDHIVILMMENRSFDHMIGYLSLSGRADVDGLQPGMLNSYQPAAGGAPVRVGISPMVSTGMAGFSDPCHKGACVDRQVANNMSGFVQNYHDTWPSDDPSIVMRYFQAADVPIYDFFAREFTIADRWFSSVLGETWPNRLYAVSGSAAGSRDNAPIPLYSNKSFVRYLDAQNVTWKAYDNQNQRTIMIADSNYRSSSHFEPLFGTYGFLQDAANGTLPSVSWIDPHFFSNDDHPLADISQGQSLVARVYSALAGNQTLWAKTLFVVVYDEHGGFFDHVVPPKAEDDSPFTFGQYGVRVPALLMGGSVDRGVCINGTFDHTSLIKTILLRFCAAGGAIPNMGKRVRNAAHLGVALSLPSPRPAPPLPAVAAAKLASFQGTAFLEALHGPSAPHTSPDQLKFVAALRANALELEGGTPTRRKPKAARAVTAAGKRTGGKGPKAAGKRP